MRNYAFTLLLFYVAAGLQAQNLSITGTVVDASQNILPGATIALRYPWGEVVKGTSSNEKGFFALEKLEKGGYKLEISMVGWVSFTKEITLSTEDVALGTISLEQSSKVLDEVAIKEAMPTARQNGDTTEFNAGAFKVMKDASSEELIQKMPSVTVENGTLKAQGENVGQVLVDGKPFFGNDPAAALKNLPAEVVEKVQIFDQQSEQSQFTGFSDGNTTKTINIVTKSGMRNGQFGKIYAGYGYPDRYQAGGNISYFKGQRRISFIGMSNNINVQNFSSEDLLGVLGSAGGRSRRPGGGGSGGGGRGGSSGSTGDFLVRPSGGIATTHATGINYSDQWSAKVSVSASYFLNYSKTESVENSFTQFVNNPEALSQTYTENILANNDNANHRLNARIEYKIDSSNSLLFRPQLSFQKNKGNSQTIGSAMLESDLLSATENTFLSDLSALNLNNSLLWRHKFGKKGRTISIDASHGYAPQRGEKFLNSFDAYFSGLTRLDSLDQKSTVDANKWNLASNVEYSEPVGANAQVLVNYRFSYQQESSDKETFDFFAPDAGYTLLNAPLTNVFSNDYITHQTGAAYAYTLGRDLNFNVRSNVQWATLSNLKTIPFADTFQQQFFNVLPSAMLRYNLDASRSIRVFYRSNTQLPGVSQLQDVLDNSNPLQLKVGNPDLKQSTQHALFLRYMATNTPKSSTFFTMLSGTLGQRYIANATYLANSGDPLLSTYQVPAGAQLTRPVNLDGYRTIRGFVSYGHPIKWIKTNLNTDISYNYTRTPGLLNSQANFSNSHNVGAGITLGSNINTKVDFNVAFRPSWTKVINSLDGANSSEYLSQSTRLRFNWIIVEGFVLRTDLSYNTYSGLSDAYNQHYVLWNLAIGKKVFKNQRGEIALAVNDVLKQNRSIQRNVTETYLEDVETNSLRQFVMLSFSYDIRNFNSKGAGQPPSDADRPFQPGMMMHPPDH